MIRLILIFAIFLAVYPMIGDGYAQFSNDFNIAGVSHWISEQFANLKR